MKILGRTRGDVFPVLALVVAGCLPSMSQAQEPNPQGAAAVPQPALRPDYVLGPNDQILVRSNADELNGRPFRVDTDGFITFPLVGRIQASGSTVTALEATLLSRLREYIREPQVTITVSQYRSEPVFFLGAFRTPGVYALEGGHTLIEMLARVGGLLPNAGHRIRVTRRAENGAIPLPSATTDPDRGTSTVEISLESLTRDINPAEDITLQAYDVVTVDQAPPVYVNGEVARPSALDLGARDSISVLQALTQAGGFMPTARRSKVRILRPVLGTTKLAQIDIDIKDILDGKANDFPLLPNDILFVPRVPAGSNLLPSMTSGIFTSLPYVLVTLLLR